MQGGSKKKLKWSGVSGFFFSNNSVSIPSCYFISERKSAIVYLRIVSSLSEEVETPSASNLAIYYKFMEHVQYAISGRGSPLKYHKICSREEIINMQSHESHVHVSKLVPSVISSLEQML